MAAMLSFSRIESPGRVKTTSHLNRRCIEAWLRCESMFWPAAVGIFGVNPKGGKM